MKTNIRFARPAALSLLLGVLALHSLAQKITYSEPEREDSRRTNFEIIGRVGGNFLVFKNNRNNNDISVYDASMKLIGRVPQTDMDDRWINVDFISYPDFAWMIYQVQRKNIVHCMALKISGEGKRISEPLELDTSRIGWAATNKIYSLAFSDDKRQVMIYKINNRDKQNFIFTTLLFDQQLTLRYRHTISMAMEERNEYFTDFLLDNDGDFVFGKFIRRSGTDFVTDVTLVTKKSQEPFFRITPVKSSQEYLDEVKIKLDNANRRILMNAFYYRQRRSSTEGLCSWKWEKDSLTLIAERSTPFTEEMRKQAKGPDGNLKTAFNEFFITDVVTRRDGGYILLSEAAYTTSRGNVYDRWGYRMWNNPWLTPMDFYYWSPYFNPYSSFYWDRWNFGRGSTQGTRYHCENIFVISFGPEGQLEWTNSISKNQFDDQTDALISHLLFKSGSELQVLFNQYERRALILNNQGISSDGRINRYPTLKNLDREVEFMPRLGKQVSARSVMIPCLNRNSLIFAKIEF